MVACSSKIAMNGWLVWHCVLNTPPIYSAASVEESLLRNCALIWCWKQGKIDQRPGCHGGWLQNATYIKWTNWSCYIAIRMFQDVCRQWISLGDVACRTMAVMVLASCNEGMERKEYVCVCQVLSFIRMCKTGEKETGEEEGNIAERCWYEWLMVTCANPSEKLDLSTVFYLRHWAKEFMIYPQIEQMSLICTEIIYYCANKITPHHRYIWIWQITVVQVQVLLLAVCANLSTFLRIVVCSKCHCKLMCFLSINFTANIPQFNNKYICIMKMHGQGSCHVMVILKEKVFLSVRINTEIDCSNICESSSWICPAEYVSHWT